MPKMRKNNFKVAFAGGGPFAVPIFTKLAENYGDLVLITKRDKPKGRGGKVEASPIKELAKKKNIQIYEPKNKLEMEEIVAKVKPDLVIVASLGIIITQKTLDMPKYGFLNVHFSLLPLHRGSCPVQTTILNGDKKAGVTIQKMAAEVDSGDIIGQEEISLNGSETTASLGAKLSELGAKKIIGIIEDYTSGKILPRKQNHSKASFTKMIEKSDGKIDWNEPAEIIERKVRAYHPWPGTYTFWNGKMLKIIEAAVSDNESGQKIGAFIELDSGSGSGLTRLYGVQTGKGTLLINKLQLEGKKPLDVFDFIKGYPDILKSILEPRDKR